MEPCARAAQDYRYLLERGYRAASALEFVANHYQLRRMERDFLFRAVCAGPVARQRRKKTVSVEMLTGARLVIDGYNCLITLESALAGRPLIMGDDGFMRDVARIFRKFRPTERTRQAWRLISEVLLRFPPDFTFVFLDSTMSRSGELAGRINRWMEDAGLRGRCSALRCLEKRLAALKGIKVSADSVIIDSADMVFDMAGFVAIEMLDVRPLELAVDERGGVS